MDTENGNVFSVCDDPQCPGYQKFLESLKAGHEQGLIKVHVICTIMGPEIVGEYLWCEPVEDGTARVCNVPFFLEHVGMGDLIRYETLEGCDNEFVEVLAACSRTLWITYEGGDEAFQELCQYFRGFEWMPEGMQTGLMVVGVPLENTPDKVEEIMNDAPGDYQWSGLSVYAAERNKYGIEDES